MRVTSNKVYNMRLASRERKESMATGKALCKIRCLLVAVVCAAVFGHVCAVTPFPKMSSPRTLTTGPHEHFIANYFGLDAHRAANASEDLQRRIIA